VPPDPKSAAQWQIWQVKWDHEDGTSKDRPALLFSPSINNLVNDYWFLKITGEDHPSPHKFLLEERDSAFASTGLKKDSYFYPEKVQKKKPNDLLYYRGYLGPLTIWALDRLIRAAVNFQRPY